MRARDYLKLSMLLLAGLILLVSGRTAFGVSVTTADVELKILMPAPYQVTQRTGYIPDRAGANESGGPRLGHGAVEIMVNVGAAAQGRMQYRTSLLNNGFGKAVPWTPLAGRLSGDTFRGRATLPAGGWYRLELRLVSHAGEVVAAAAVEPVGVGEVFLIAGQSNAAGYSDEHTRIEDPEGRVAAYDVGSGRWAVAHDPQPNAGPGGTIWPPMCNALLPVIQVPIGLANVAVASTSSSQWLPGEKLYDRLAAAGRAVGRFRFVLWQQGESDVIKKVPAGVYAHNMTLIRRRLEGEWGFNPPWLLAKSTLHPTVYNDPPHEGQIRKAISLLWQQDGFRRGPDTDVLGGENRGGHRSRRHFSAVGQKRAGLMWFAAVWNQLQLEGAPRPGRRRAQPARRSARHSTTSAP